MTDNMHTLPPLPPPPPPLPKPTIGRTLNVFDVGFLSVAIFVALVTSSIISSVLFFSLFDVEDFFLLDAWTAVISGLSFAGLTMLYVVVIRGISLPMLGLRRTTAVWIGYAVIFTGVMLGIQMLLQLTLFELLRDSLGSDEEAVEQTFSGGLLGLGVLVIAIGLIVPFAEEVFFRGLVYTWLRARVGVFAAIFFSGTFFGLLHINPLSIVYISVYGIAWAWFYEKSHSIWPGIVSHALNNSFAVLLNYLVFS